MAYIINKYNGEILVSLQDGTLDNSTSLGLLGRNYTGYGETQNENFLFLLENFANDTAPLRPLAGQLWYDTTNDVLKVYDEAWSVVGSAIVGTELPDTAVNGSLFLKNNEEKQFYVYADNDWQLIGPSFVEGFGVTRDVGLSIVDTQGVSHPAILRIVDNIVISITSSDDFSFRYADQDSISVTGNQNLVRSISQGINVVESNYPFVGNLQGTAQFADQLKTPRSINGVQFDGTQDITISSATTNSLIAGDYISGNSFDGSSDATWSVFATPNNTVGAIVARDNSGNFTANEITADLVGDVTGNITASSGTSTFNRLEANEIVGLTFSGNSFTAQKLQTARKINGVDFDGTTDITVPASANTLTGNTLASGVTESNLQTLGTISSLDIGTTGINVNNLMTISANDTPTVSADSEIDLTIGINSPLKLVDGDKASILGGDDVLTLYSQSINIGIPSVPIKKIYANELNGVASSAQYADLAENYESDLEYQPGTVVIFGGSHQITHSVKSNDHRVAGVVSENPAYLMNRDAVGTHVLPIALQGLVSCKVVGRAKKGDLLVTSHLQGIATVNNTPLPGTIIGKAIEDKSNDGVDTVMIVVGKH